MIDNDKIILPLTSAEETKEELRIEEQDKEMRRVLKSIKREDWVITDYRLAYEMLESDFLVIGEALYKFYWESPRTKKAAGEALDIIRNVIKKEVLMEKILESDEIDKGFVGLEEKIRDIKKIKEEEWTISDYSLMFDYLIFDLYEINSVLDIYDKGTKTIDDMEKSLWDIHEITHREF